MYQVLLYPLFNKTAVTCIKICNSNLFAGVGGDLCLYDISEFVDLKNRLNVFDNDTIHGIMFNSNNSMICVFGGKHVTVLRVHYGSTHISLTLVQKWKMSDWILYCQWIETDTQLSMLTSRNKLSLFDPYTGTNMANIACAEKCTLYSAVVLSSSWSDSVVIAGTVYQQVIIWIVADKALTDKPVHKKLHGHKGVVFSVTYDYRSRLISSTSDDRTIRLWSVVSTKIGHLTAEDWKDASISLAFTIFGHTARVWRSYTLADKKIVSIGEDSMLCLWSVTGECISCQETHQGGGVWCMDVAEDLSVIATGGADGGINLWPIESASLMTCHIPAPSEIPKRITLLNSSRILVVTESGSLLLYSDQKWSIVFTDSRILSYCLMEISPSRKLIGLATIKGHIIILQALDFTKIIDTQVEEGRIYSLHWLMEDILLSCHDHGNLYIWGLKRTGLEEVGIVYLPECRERWTTSAVLWDNTVVYGDRAGHIHSSPLNLHSNPTIAVRTVEHAHNRLGVCSLCEFAGFIWSTGRDSTVKQFSLSSHVLTLIMSCKLPVDWAALIFHTHLLGSVVLCFHESSVILWSIQERRKLTSLQCGGGHRSWVCLIEENQLSFAYLKDKTAHTMQCLLSNISRPVLMDGFHVREINSMVHIANGWIVSGGEDGSVRLSLFRNSSWTTHAVEQKHLSSVRSVLAFTLKLQLFLFSAGGRAQFKIWMINSEKSNTLIELNSVMLRKERQGRHWINTNPLEEPEIRFMDLTAFQLTDCIICLVTACSDGFLRIFHYDSNNNKIEFHNSVRSNCHCILRITSFQIEDSKIVILTTATDGSVSFWITCTMQRSLAMFACEYLHQSGVNGLSVSRYGLEADSLLVATGGDDNTLSVCYFQIITESLSTSLHKLASWTNSSLHSSVITGVQIVRDWIVCSAGDWRVTLLSWRLAEGCLCVDFVAQTCCSVPDIKGLTILQADKETFTVCVYGVGTEVLQLKQNK